MRNRQYNSANDFNYSYDGRSLTITGPSDRHAAELHIPPLIDGHEVNAIGNGAFQFCHDLKRISIPDTVTMIDNAAFKGCENLVEAELSSALNSIGALAFQGCSALRVLTMSNHADRIEINSFKDCHSLEIINVKLRDRQEGGNIISNSAGSHIVGHGNDFSVIKHPKYGLIKRTAEHDIRSFAIASESDEGIWLYLRAIMRATDPRGGKMDKYDATFLEIRSEDDMYRVAARRLSDPYNLSRRMYKVYKDSLMGMIESIIRADRVDRLTKLGELGCIDNELLSEYIELAGRIGGGCIAYLLEHQNRYAKADKYDYSL